MPMSPEFVRDRVAHLRALQRADFDAAYAGADELRSQVLEEIADGNPEVAALAREALVTIREDIGGE